MSATERAAIPRKRLLERLALLESAEASLRSIWGYRHLVVVSAVGCGWRLLRLTDDGAALVEKAGKLVFGGSLGQIFDEDLIPLKLARCRDGDAVCDRHGQRGAHASTCGGDAATLAGQSFMFTLGPVCATSL
eukprot:scaffold62927_cov32-Tisochrysis_lutea.AAC.3